MSNFQLDQERGKAIKIAMPPLPEELIVEAAQPEQIQPEPQIIEQSEPETIEATPESEPVLKTQDEKSSSKEANFANLRKAKEQAERERDEAIRLLRERLQAEQPKVQAQEQPESDDLGIGADDIAEGKHLSKVDKRIRKLQQELEQYKQQSTQTTIEARLKSQYPDFEKVVSKENIEVFREMHPELAASINASPDLYNKAVSAYQLIKKLGIHPEEPYIADKERALKNAAKPKPLASISPQRGESPLSSANAFANGLTKDLKAQLLKEMNDAKANY